MAESKSKAGNALMAYAKKSGGIDKTDMMTVASKLQNFAHTGNPSNKLDIANLLKKMDTDARDKVIEIIMKNDPTMGRGLMAKAGFKMEAAEVEEMDDLNKKALKKNFKDRKDQDIDNDGDVDSSDKYLHKRRQAVSKAIAKQKDNA